MKKKANIVYIFIDQLRKDSISFYGQPNIQTPHIDRLFRESVSFENNYSTVPLCSPFRAMLMTGRYPTHNGTINNFLDSSSRQNPNCIANVFNENGYQTAFIGKWHLGRGVYKENEDYKMVEKYIPSETSEYVPPEERLGFQYFAGYNFHLNFNDFYYFLDEPKRIHSGKYETDTETDLAIEYMEQHKDDTEPFMLMVAPHPPHPLHIPDQVPAGYLDKVPQELIWRENVPQDHNPLDTLSMRCYYAMVLNVDDNIGRIMRWLEENKLLEDTIVVLTADHGDQLGSHSLHHKMVPYRESLDTPLAIYWKGRTKPASRRETVFTPIDFFPTLCAMTGVGPVPLEVDGVDLSGAILEDTEINRGSVLIANYSSHWNEFRSDTPETAPDWRCWPEWRGVRDQRYTYVKWLSGKEELYDNDEDPYQYNNIIKDPAQQERFRYYRDELKRLMIEAHDDFLPGTAYAEWFGLGRELIKTGLGCVKK